MLPVLALVAMLALAGCGGGDDSSDGSTSATASKASESDGGAEGGKQTKGDSESGEGKQGSDKSSNGKTGPGVAQPNGERESGITPEQRKKATTASIKLESPAFSAEKPLSARYTCDGEDESPPLRWSGLPSEAAELVLFVLNLSPVNESLFFDWAVAGLDPSLTGLEAGEVPAGAIVGKNSFGKSGYSICPPEGKGENYIFMLFAIPQSLSLSPGFDPLSAREEVLAQSGNVGLLGASYKRG